jgi:predicted nucleic acid-binding protein
MILVDTSVWIDHLQRIDPFLQKLLLDGRVVCHTMVIGEIAVGSFKQREVILNKLRELPTVASAGHEEVLHFISRHSLFGSGIGYIDAHLLAAARLTRGTLIWTRDKRLALAAESLGIIFNL